MFDDLDDLNEDNMQKLNLKPTPIYQPNKRITFEKRKKYALQKKLILRESITKLKMSIKKINIIILVSKMKMKA